MTRPSRPCRPSRRLAGLLVIVLAADASSVHAQERVPFRVEYRPGLHCPNTEGFSEQLLARSSRVRKALSGEPALSFRVELGGAPGALVGQLTLLEPNGRVTVRVVPGTSCDELTSAMGVIAAVLVETQSASIAKPVDEPQERVPADVAHDEPSRRTSHWRAGGGVGLAVEGAVAPDLVAGLSVEATLALDRASVLSPGFALAFVRTLSDRVRAQNGTARFQWNALRVTVCPLRWPASGWFALRPCALLDAGVLEATGENTDRPASKAVSWFAVGGALRAEALLTRPLVLTLEGGLVAPLRRDRFYFDPDTRATTAFDVQPVGALARLGVSAQFW